MANRENGEIIRSATTGPNKSVLVKIEPGNWHNRNEVGYFWGINGWMSRSSHQTPSSIEPGEIIRRIGPNNGAASARTAIYSESV